MYNSEFCIVTYVPKDNIILLIWKKFCNGEDYRNPVKNALELLKAHVGSNIVVDARNGFEDDKEDVEWAFSEFIPEMAKTDCKKVVFIMNEVNKIEAEMDMWMKEFSKYFKVIRVSSYDEAINILRYEEDQIVMHVTYMVKSGKRDEFYRKLRDNGIVEGSKREKGNLQYDYYYPVDNENEILLLEIWKDLEAQRLHTNTEHFKLLQELKKEYVIDVQIEQFYVNTSII